MRAEQTEEIRALARAVKQHAEALVVWKLEAMPVSRGTGSKTSALRRVEQEVIACRRCALYRTRTHHVFGEGSPEAKLVFVGEAPGREEDFQGRPFVGAAGQLLTKMIESIGLQRREVYICNVLKDRPPGNRTPEPEEIAACLPFLERQLVLLKPKVICALGAIAAKALLGSGISITSIRGEIHEYLGIPLVPTFHPAYLLRNPSAKRLAWQDLKRVKALLESNT